MSRHSLTKNEERNVIQMLREVVQEFKYEILDDEPIDGAEFLQSMSPILHIMKSEIEE